MQPALNPVGPQIDRGQQTLIAAPTDDANHIPLAAASPTKGAIVRVVRPAWPIESANLKLGPVPTKKRQGLATDVQALSDAIRSYPWTTLTALKGDPEAMRAIQEAEKLIKELKRALKG